MPQGPGKYDEDCSGILIKTGAEAVVLMVLGGRVGSGFSVTATSPLIAPQLPALLRSVADQIEKDTQ